MNAWPDLLCTALPPAARDHVERVPGEPRVVHDPLARVLLQEALREHPDDVVALDEVAALVEEEAAVVVAVPRNPEVGASACARVDRAARFSSIIGFGTPFGNVPSGSWKTFTNSNGRCGSSWSMIGPAPPLPAFTTILSGCELLAIHVGQEMLDVVAA